MGETNNVLGSLADAIADMEEDDAARLAREALDTGIDASQIVFDGILKGMAIASDRWDSGEYFVPELLLCSDALYAALNIVGPHLPSESSSDAIRVVIGVVEGDTHDIGKNNDIYAQQMKQEAPLSACQVVSRRQGVCVLLNRHSRESGNLPGAR